MTDETPPDLTAHLEREKRTLNEQKRQIDARLAEIEKKLLQAKIQRLTPHGYCRNCWPDHGEAARLYPIPADPKNPKIDLFKCRVCGATY